MEEDRVEASASGKASTEEVASEFGCSDNAESSRLSGAFTVLSY